MSQNDDFIRALIGGFEGSETEKRRLERTLRQADFSMDYGPLSYALAEMQAAHLPLTSAVQNYIADKVVARFDHAYANYKKNFSPSDPYSQERIQAGREPMMSRTEYFARNIDAFRQVQRQPIDLRWGSSQEAAPGKTIGEMFPTAFSAGTVGEAMNVLTLSEMPQIMSRLVRNYTHPETGRINYRSVSQNFLDELMEGYRAGFERIPNFRSQAGNFNVEFGRNARNAIKEFRRRESEYSGGRTNFSDLLGDTADWGYSSLDTANPALATDAFSSLPFVDGDGDKIRDTITSRQLANNDPGNMELLDVQTGRRDVVEDGNWLRGYDPTTVRLKNIPAGSPAARAGVPEGVEVEQLGAVLHGPQRYQYVDAVENGMPVTFYGNYRDASGQVRSQLFSIQPEAVHGRAADSPPERNWIGKLAHDLDPQLGRIMVDVGRGTAASRAQPTDGNEAGGIKTGLWTTHREYTRGVYEGPDRSWRLAPLNEHRGGEYQYPVVTDPSAMNIFSKMYDAWGGDWQKFDRVYQKARSSADAVVEKRRAAAVAGGRGMQFPQYEAAVQDQMRYEYRRLEVDQKRAAFLHSGQLMVDALRPVSKMFAGAAAEADGASLSVDQFEAYYASQIVERDAESVFQPSSQAEDDWKGSGIYQRGEIDERVVHYTRHPEAGDGGGLGEYLVPEGGRSLSLSPFTIAGTGHRPDRLGGYGNRAAALQLRQIAGRQLDQLKPARVISGGAQGWDQAIAEAALERKIPVEMVLPFESFGENWPKEARQQFRRLRERVEKAGGVVTTLPGDPKTEKVTDLFAARDRYMINRADLTLAMYNGEKHGGTAGAVAYSLARGVPVKNVWGAFQGSQTRTDVPLAPLPKDRDSERAYDTALLGGDPGLYAEQAGADDVVQPRSYHTAARSASPLTGSVTQVNRDPRDRIIGARLQRDSEPGHNEDLEATSQIASDAAIDRRFQEALRLLADPKNPSASQSARIGAIAAAQGDENVNWGNVFRELNMDFPENATTYRALAKGEPRSRSAPRPEPGDSHVVQAPGVKGRVMAKYSPNQLDEMRPGRLGYDPTTGDFDPLAMENTPLSSRLAARGGGSSGQGVSGAGNGRTPRPAGGNGQGGEPPEEPPFDWDFLPELGPDGDGDPDMGGAQSLPNSTYRGNGATQPRRLARGRGVFAHKPARTLPDQADIWWSANVANSSPDERAVDPPDADPLRPVGNFNDPEERERRAEARRSIVDHPAAFPMRPARGMLFESETADGGLRVLQARRTGEGPSASTIWMEQAEDGSWSAATNVPTHGTISREGQVLGHVSREAADQWRAEAPARAQEWVDREEARRVASRHRSTTTPTERAIEAARGVGVGEILKLNRREIRGMPERIGTTGETYEVAYLDDDNNRRVSVSSEMASAAHGMAQDAMTSTFHSELPSNPAARVAAVKQRILDHALDGVQKYVDEQIASGVSPDLARANGEKFKQVVQHYAGAVSRVAARTLGEELGVTPGDVARINNSDVRLKSLDEVNALLERSPAAREQLGGRSPEQVWASGEYFPVQDEGGNVFDIGTQGKYARGSRGFDQFGGQGGFGKFGSVFYASYLLKREWQMTMGQHMANATAYGNYISEMGTAFLPEGVSAGATDVGYANRQAYGQHYMGRGAYEVLGGFQDIPFLMSGMGGAPSRLATNAGMAAGVGMGGQLLGFGLGMMAPAGSAMAGVASAMGPIGWGAAAVIGGGALAMEAYNAIAKPEDPATWGSLFRGAEQMYLENKGWNPAKDAKFGATYAERPEAFQGLSIFEWSSTKGKYRPSRDEIAEHLTWQEAQVLLYEGTPDEVRDMEEFAGRLSIDTGESMDNITAGFMAQKRLLGKTDKDLAATVSKRAMARGMSSPQFLGEAGQYASTFGLAGTAAFDQAFNTYVNEEDFAAASQMAYEATSWGRFGNQIQAFYAPGTSYGAGTQVARRRGIDTQSEMGAMQSGQAALERFRNTPLSESQIDQLGGIFGSVSPEVGQVIAQAMGMGGMAGMDTGQQMQFASVLSSAGMGTQDASVYGRMMQGDLRAYSYQAWQTGNMGNAFFDRAGRSIVQHNGAVGMQVYNHWAPKVGLGGGNLTTAGFLNTSDQSIISAFEDGGFSGLQKLANEKSYAASMASIGIQLKGIALSENFYWGANAGGTWDSPTRGSAWGIEDRQLALGHQSAMANFADQWTRMTTANDFAVRREDNQLQRMNSSHTFSQWQWSSQYNQFNQQQMWAREDWQFQDTSRNLNFGWQMEDMNEAIRFASGRERRTLVRQRDRAALSHNLEEGQIETQRDRQQQVWAQEEERHQKQRQYMLEMQTLDRESFDLNKDQREEFFKLDTQAHQRRLKEYEEEKKLSDELRELQRKFQFDQLQLQKEAAGAQAAAAAAQYEINKAIAEGQKKWEELTGTIGEMNNYNNAFRLASATEEMFRMMDGVSTVRVQKLIELIRTISSTSANPSQRYGGERE